MTTPNAESLLLLHFYRCLFLAIHLSTSHIMLISRHQHEITAQKSSAGQVKLQEERCRENHVPFDLFYSSFKLLGQVGVPDSPQRRRQLPEKLLQPPNGAHQ